MHDLIRDLRYGVRMLLRRPGFTVVAALSLAAGIGLNTTMFSVVNAVLLRDARFHEPERLVEIYTSASDQFPHLTSSYADYADIRDGADTLDGVAAHALVRGILTAGGHSELVTGECATANYFDVLGIRPALGRALLAEEDVTEGTHPVVVLSHGLWQRRFASRAQVLGETLKLSNVVYTVVGVAPAGFSGTIPGFQPQFWVPTMMVGKLQFSGVQTTTDKMVGDTRIQRRGHRWLFVRGRLAPGRTVAEAQVQVETIFSRLREQYPDSNKDAKPAVIAGANVRFHPLVDGYVRAAGAVLLVAVALVLTIACANVANMLLARGAARRREFAIRAAIGADRGRLLRQLLSESLVLAVLGGGLGLLIALWAGRGLSALRTDWLPVPIHFSYGVDTTVLVYAVAAALATAVLFGLAPAWRASRPDLVPALKADSMGEETGRRKATLRDALVVGQLAVSLVLLVGGALLTRGLLTAQTTDLGFDPKPIASMSFSLQMNGYDLKRATALRDRVLEHLRALPQVEAATVASRLPLAPNISVTGVSIPGHHGPDDDGAVVDVAAVGPDYFKVVGVPIVEGRAFTESDRVGSPLVAIINETLARTYWPDRSAVGERLFDSGFDRPPYEIVGVSRDHKVRSVGESPRPYLQRASFQNPTRSVHLAVRTRGPAGAALPVLRATILELDPEIVFTEETTAEAVAATTVAPTRIGAALLAAFGAVALLLAAIGLYGVISYSVVRRTREFGVRLALGAGRGDVVRLVLRQGLRLATVGVLLGCALAAGLARVLGSLLYGVSAWDPIAYTLAASILLGVVAAANLVPAYRAARADPLRALRHE